MVTQDRGEEAMKRILLVAFNGDPICFVHVLLNALDMKAKNYDVKLVIEGSATQLIPDLASGVNPLSGLYSKVKQAGLINAVCKACSAKMNVLDQVIAEGLPLGDDMSGHPSLGKYMDEGYQLITF